MLFSSDSELCAMCHAVLVSGNLLRREGKAECCFHCPHSPENETSRGTCDWKSQKTVIPLIILLPMV